MTDALRPNLDEVGQASDSPRDSSREPAPPVHEESAVRKTNAAPDSDIASSHGEAAPPDTDADLPPIHDPYLTAPLPDLTAPPPRSKLSQLALTSIISGCLPLPLFSVAAILFGWAARREIAASSVKLRGYGLATIGMVLGVFFTMVWGAVLSVGLWTWRYRSDPQLAELGGPVVATEPVASVPAAPSAPDPIAPSAPDPAAKPDPKSDFVVPKATKVRQEGSIVVVDIGVSESSLSEALAKQRAIGARAGETMMVMTTRASCEPCGGVDASLRDPLLQTALAKVRLVRVDIEVFHEDLDELRIPHRRIPGFFLLAPDLSPRDGIDGGEWDEDIPPNIAPVLGAFLRGKYATRREPWQPLPGSGMRL